MNCYLIKYKYYYNVEEEHCNGKKLNLVYAKSFEEACKKLENLNKDLILSDFQNLTIR